MSPTKKWFFAMTVSAFASVISFFHINSYVADKNDINWLFTVIGVVVGLFAVYCLKNVAKHGGSSKDSGL